MLKKTMDIELAKKKVANLIGKELLIRYNKGRNKIVYLKGSICEYHNNVFVIKIYDEIFDRLSCSYSDLLCGDIAFKEK